MYKTHEVNPYTCWRWQSKHFTMHLNFSKHYKLYWLEKKKDFSSLNNCHLYHNDKTHYKESFLKNYDKQWRKSEKCSCVWDAREPSWQHSSLCEVEAFVVNTRKAVERGNGVWNHYRKCMLKQGLSQLWLP